MALRVIRDDIIHMDTDAIVLPANKNLKAGTGASAAIFRKANAQKLEGELRLSSGNKCEMGHAVITFSYGLPANYVIHAVCPQWLGGDKEEDRFLRSAYTESLRLAKEKKLKSVAFPLLSTGNYRYPIKEAMLIAVRAITDFLMENDMDVYLVLFSRESVTIARSIFPDIRENIDDDYVAEAEVSYYEYMDREVRQGTRMSRRRVGNFEPYDYPDWYGQEADRIAKAKAPLKEDERTIDDLIAEGRETFGEMLNRLIDESGKTNAEIYKNALMSKQTFHKIKSNPDMTPKKKSIISLAMSLNLDIETTRVLLEKAGYSLSLNSMFDVIVTYFIEHGKYDCKLLNDELFFRDLEDEMIGRKPRSR